MIEQYTSPAVVNNSQEPWLVGEGVSLSGSIAIPSLDFNFVTNAFPGTVTFTRASTATYFDSAGVLQSAAINAPRLDYDPATLLPRGFLVEEQRTNSIRNNTMQGAVAGTPGTLPTNWVRFVSGTAATSVVGTGIENGITYIDVAFSGGNTDGISFFVDGNIGHAALNGQTWTGSAYYKLTAGSFANCLINHVVYEANILGTALAASSITLSTVTSAALSTQRVVVTRTNNNAFTAEEQLAVVIVGTGAFSFTLRIGLPQLELGAFATSVIPTTTTALTRSADVAAVNTLSPWFNAAEGTLFAEGILVGGVASTFPNQVGFVGANVNTDSIRIGWNANNSVMSYGVRVSGTGQANISAGPNKSAGSSYKVAGRYAVNNFQAAFDGALGTPDTSGTLPTITSLLLGGVTTFQPAGNLWLRRTTYYPRALSDAELQALTA